MTEEEYRVAMTTPIQLGGISTTLKQAITQAPPSNWAQQLSGIRRNIRQYYAPSGQYGRLGQGQTPPPYLGGGGRLKRDNRIP